MLAKTHREASTPDLAREPIGESGMVARHRVCEHPPEGPEAVLGVDRAGRRVVDARQACSWRVARGSEEIGLKARAGLPQVMPEPRQVRPVGRSELLSVVGCEIGGPFEVFDERMEAPRVPVAREVGEELRCVARPDRPVPLFRGRSRPRWALEVRRGPTS